MNYYLENAEDEGYTLQETQKLYGTEASEVAGTLKQFTGFTTPVEQVKVVTVDGKMSIDYYYIRNIYEVQFISNYAAIIESKTYKYGQMLPTPIRENYTFDVSCQGSVPHAAPAARAGW